MNNYGERSMGHKRSRMDEGGPGPGPGLGLVQGNGLPLGYMDNGHQIPYQPYAGAYNAHYPPADVAFGAYGGGELAGYAARGLGYAPPAHQAYPPQPGFPQQQMLHSPYEHHHAHHKSAWPPQPQPQPQLMQPLQVQNSPGPEQSQLKGEATVKKEIKAEPAPEPPAPLAMRAPDTHPGAGAGAGFSFPVGAALGGPAEEPPKIKIKTDLFKDDAGPARAAQPDADRSGAAKGDNDEHKSAAAAANTVKADKITSDGELEVTKARQLLAASSGDAPSDCGLAERGLGEVPSSSTPTEGSSESGAGAPEAEAGAKSRISDSGNSTDSTNKNKFQGFSDSDSSSSSAEDETKIPNEIYFGTPDVSTYRPKLPGVSPLPVASPAPGATPPAAPPRPSAPLTEGKKRGRPKGSTNKPKPPELIAQQKMMGMSSGGVPRPVLGRPRGGGHSSSFMTHAVRPFKRDFSGIRFRRRWSDDGLDSSNIPNEVYFGDVPVSMEVLYNFHDSHADREKQQQATAQAGGVTLVYSSSDSSSDDDSDSDSSGDTDPNQDPSQHKRRPGRPRGSKTINRRSDGPRTPSLGSPGDKPPGITHMKKFLKLAGVEYDYVKLVDGCTSNKERVNRLLALLRDKGLEGEPTVESCRALYSGPPPRRRGPKPGTKRTPRKSRAPPEEEDEGDADTGGTPARPTPAPGEPGSRRVTRGQTSGSPRKRIVISSDEEDSHTPLSKLRTVR